LDNAGISKLHLMMKPQESSSAQLSKLKCDSPGRILWHACFMPLGTLL
jgi:hypothetical protein